MFRKVALLVLVAAVVTLTAAGALQAQGSRSVFGWVVANRATIQDGGLIVTGDTDLAGDITVTGEIDANGDTTLTAATVGTFLTLDEADVITVTNGATLTPLGSFQPIASAGAVGFGAIAAPTAGNILIVENTVNQTITITDSATLRLGGNAVLAQYDTLVLVYDGNTWVQLSKTDN
jgi:hypothetical protein